MKSILYFLVFIVVIATESSKPKVGKEELAKIPDLEKFIADHGNFKSKGEELIGDFTDEKEEDWREKLARLTSKYVSKNKKEATKDSAKKDEKNTKQKAESSKKKKEAAKVEKDAETTKEAQKKDAKKKTSKADAKSVKVETTKEAAKITKTGENTGAPTEKSDAKKEVESKKAGKVETTKEAVRSTKEAKKEAETTKEAKKEVETTSEAKKQVESTKAEEVETTKEAVKTTKQAETATEKIETTSEAKSTQKATTKYSGLTTIEFHFEGDFEEVVGSKKSEFIMECEEYVKPCACLDVFSGSVVVLVQGPTLTMQGVTSRLSSSGLKLPSFKPLKKLLKKVKKDMSPKSTEKPDGIEEAAFECSDEGCEVEQTLKVIPGSEIQIWVMQTDADNSNAFIEFYDDGKKQKTCVPPKDNKCGEYYSCGFGTIGSTTHQETIKLKAAGRIKEKCEDIDSVVEAKVTYFPPGKQGTLENDSRIALFKGVFSKTIDDKEKFLKECSRIDDITCTDAGPDVESKNSIAVTIEGSTENIEKAEKLFKREGMKTESFGTLELDERAPFPFKNPSPTSEPKVPTLISNAQKQQLNRLIGTEGLQWKLCYDKERDGANANTFRKLCEDKGPSITVIRTVKGKVIGGYNPIAWKGTECNLEKGEKKIKCYKSSKRAFLFAAANGMKKYEVQKPGYAIRDTVRKHPIFGGGHDIYINIKADEVHCNLGFTFKCAPKLKEETCHEEFCGSKEGKIRIEDYQVWILTGGVPDGEKAKPDNPDDYDCCEIAEMFSKVEGQKWIEAPPKKMLKWWDDNTCDADLVAKCELQPRLYNTKLGCEGADKNLVRPQPETKCDGEEGCETSARKQCDVIPNCTSFSVSEEWNKWRPRYYTSKDCVEKKGSKVQYSVKQPAGTKVPPLTQIHAKALKDAKASSSYKIREGCRPPADALFDPELDHDCKGKDACIKLAKKECDENDDCFSFAIPKSGDFQPSYYIDDECDPDSKFDFYIKSDPNIMSMTRGYALVGAGWCEDSAANYFNWKSNCGAMDGCPENTVETCAQQCDDFENCVGFQFGEQMCASKKGERSSSCRLLSGSSDLGDIGTGFCGPKTGSRVSQSQQGKLPIAKASYGKENPLHCFAKKTMQNGGWTFIARGACGKHDDYKLGMDTHTLEECIDLCVKDEKCEMVSFSGSKKRCGMHEGPYDGPQPWSEPFFECFGTPEHGMKGSKAKSNQLTKAPEKATTKAAKKETTKAAKKEATKAPKVETTKEESKEKTDVLKLAVKVDGLTKDNREKICEAFGKAVDGKVTRCSMNAPGRRMLKVGILFMEISVNDAEATQSLVEEKNFAISIEGLPKDIKIEKIEVGTGAAAMKFVFTGKFEDAKRKKFVEECHSYYGPCTCEDLKTVKETVEITISCPDAKALDEAIEKTNAAGLELPSFETLQLNSAPEKVPVPEAKSTKAKQQSKGAGKKEKNGLKACPRGIVDVHSCKSVCIRADYQTGRFHHTGKCECRNTIPESETCPPKSKADDALVESTPVKKEKKKICHYDACMVKKEQKKPKRAKQKAEYVQDGYCNGDRVGVGKDKVDGKGIESLDKCAQYVSNDPRCDGTGYFDGIPVGKSYQCKCPTKDACLSKPHAHKSWKIYKTSSSDSDATKKNPFVENPTDGKCCYGNVASCLACRRNESIEDFCKEPKNAKVDGCAFANSKRKCEDVKFVKNLKDSKSTCEQAYEYILKDDPFMTECPKHLGPQCPKTCGLCLSLVEETIQAATVKPSLRYFFIFLFSGLAFLSYGAYRSLNNKLFQQGDIYQAIVSEDIDDSSMGAYWE